MLIGGPDRFNSPSFELMRAIAPWWFWGVFLIVYCIGMAAFAGTRLEWAALFVGTMPFGFIVASYFSGAMSTYSTAFVGVTIYAMLTLQHFAFAYLSWRDQYRRYRWPDRSPSDFR